MMAAQFLASHGIDLDAEMATIQFDGQSRPSQVLEGHPTRKRREVNRIMGVRLPCRPTNSLWDVAIKEGKIDDIRSHEQLTLEKSRHLPAVWDASGQLLAPSLCHAHIHLDKCFLLQDSKFTDLQVMDGSFQEAMDVTAKAKARFDGRDLLRRGQRLIKESIKSGVTAMRAFAEVDEVVKLTCLDAAIALKSQFANDCDVQICAFAQHGLFSGSDGGETNRAYMSAAAKREGVDVVGSTPYVEDGSSAMHANLKWIIELSRTHNKHLDLHLDYHLDEAKKPLVEDVIQYLKTLKWSDVHPKTCTLGHCTRLTYFKPDDWKRLREAIGDINVAFVGLPTSDLYMMRTGNRTRGTLQIPELIKNYGFEAAIGVNNVGNAFTPQGSCDPLSIASLGVGIYQTGTIEDANLLYVCNPLYIVSKRADNLHRNASLNERSGLLATIP